MRWQPDPAGGVVAVALAFYDALSRDDRDAIFALTDENVEITSVVIEVAGLEATASGHEGLRRWAERSMRSRCAR